MVEAGKRRRLFKEELRHTVGGQEVLPDDLMAPANMIRETGERVQDVSWIMRGGKGQRMTDMRGLTVWNEIIMYTGWRGRDVEMVRMCRRLG